MPRKGELLEYAVDHVFFVDLELLCDRCNLVIDTDTVVLVSERMPSRVYHAKCIEGTLLSQNKNNGHSIRVVHFECSSIPEICELIQKARSLEGKSKLPPLTFSYLASRLNTYAGYIVNGEEKDTNLDDFGENHER